MLSSRFCGSNWMLTLSSSTKLSVTKNCLVILSALQRYHSLVLESHLPTVKIHLKLVGMETAPIHFCRAYCEGEESFCGLNLKIGSRRNDIQFITPTCNFFCLMDKIVLWPSFISYPFELLLFCCNLLSSDCKD